MRKNKPFLIINLIICTLVVLVAVLGGIQYYRVSDDNRRPIYIDGVLYKVIIALLIMIGILIVIVLVYMITYKRTLKEVDSTMHSVITGLSKEYMTLWLIDTKNKTIRLLRNRNRDDIKAALSNIEDVKDYDFAINNYIDLFIKEDDRECIREAVKFEILIEKLSEEEFYTVNYIHNPFEGGSRYSQMVFTRTGQDRLGDSIVLAYRDIDNLIREELAIEAQLEEALLQAKSANESKSNFLASMSHEIRTPINAILGMDTMILRESKDDVIKNYAKDIKTASNTLLAIVNDILDFSKIESGKMELVPSNYQLDSVVNDIKNMVVPKAEEKGLKLELCLNPDMPVKLYGDELRIKQIILNIINNAIKYTPKGSIKWEIDYEILEPDVCILKSKVTDTGIGIKPEDLERLFSPDERFDSSRNRSVEGTGLGLSITKSLLEQMGSMLEVESVYGEGSVFSFAVRQPRWGNETIGDEVQDVCNVAEADEKYHAPSAKLLVVDDAEMNLFVVTSLLKRVQIEPDTCLSGKEAVKLAKERKYDIILLDAMMPEMSGKETLRAIKNEAELNKDTTMIVVTANVIVGAKQEYLDAGFDAYISKPINGNTLEDMIQKYLPKDKIITADNEAFYGKAGDSSGEINLVEAINNLPGIDTSMGIKACNGEAIYIKICRMFYESADSKIELIKKYYDLEDCENYSIQTHALKSSAKLIGHQKLSELAFEMERAGRDNDLDAMNEKTKNLLELYKEIAVGFETVYIRYASDN